jgi:hypothetical protein
MKFYSGIKGELSELSELGELGEQCDVAGVVAYTYTCR